MFCFVYVFCVLASFLKWLFFSTMVFNSNFTAKRQQNFILSIIVVLSVKNRLIKRLNTFS